MYRPSDSDPRENRRDKSKSSRRREDGAEKVEPSLPRRERRSSSPPDRRSRRRSRSPNIAESPRDKDPAVAVKPKEKPNYAPSGLLRMDHSSKNGVVLQYTEPAEARMPTVHWRLFVFRGKEEIGMFSMLKFRFNRLFHIQAYFYRFISFE